VKHTQLVLIEFDNCGAFVERFWSDGKITVGAIAKFLEDRDGADWGRDGFTLLAEPSETSLDKSQKKKQD